MIKTQENTEPIIAFEELVGYLSKNGVERSIKPIFKTDDFALYNEDSLEVMSRNTN